MAESPEKEIVQLFKGVNEKLDKVCKGIECLPDLVKKVEGIKMPEAPSAPASAQKHNVFSWMSYCPECGEKLRKEPPEYECSECHVPVDPNKDKVCWNCGSKKARRKELKVE